MPSNGIVPLHTSRTTRSEKEECVGTAAEIISKAIELLLRSLTEVLQHQTKLLECLAGGSNSLNSSAPPSENMNDIQNYCTVVQIPPATAGSVQCSVWVLLQEFL